MHPLQEGATLGERIRFYRNKRNMHGHQLAKQVGLSRYAIMDYENNQSEPALDDLKKIAEALHVNVDKLYDGYYRFLDYPYGEKIQQLRKQHSLSTQQLATMLGSDRRTIEKWENGQGMVTRKIWGKFKRIGLI